MTVAKTFSVSHWNIKGLHDNIFGCKLQSAEFFKNVSKHDIVILTETWGCSHDISVPNFEVIIIIKLISIPQRPNLLKIR